MQTEKTFSAEFLKNELDLPGGKASVHSEIVDTSRWSVHYSIVFQHEGKYWQTSYRVGATEQQDEGPWEYDDEVECQQVKQTESLVKEWVPILTACKLLDQCDLDHKALELLRSAMRARDYTAVTKAIEALGVITDPEWMSEGDPAEALIESLEVS